MALIRFPDPRDATPEGLLAIGGNLDVANLMHAYRQGIFPWPMDNWPLTWFCPPERAIISFDKLHIPARLARFARHAPYRLTIDTDFRAVIRACAEIARPEQDGTWITPQMIRAYCALHDAGYAHSIEVWEDAQLVGGLYGVDADGVFAGESMFHRRANTSKLALLHLIAHLKERGAQWMDIQVMTPHMRALGAEEISRDDFLARLAHARKRRLNLFPPRS